MSDVVWAAVISATTAIVATLLTLWLSLRIANLRLNQAERIEQSKWERAEASKRAETRADLLRKLWGHILATEVHVFRWHALAIRGCKQDMLGKFGEGRPSFHASLAHGIALTGLPDIEPLVNRYAIDTVKLESRLELFDALKPHEDQGIEAARGVWKDSYQRLWDKMVQINVASVSAT